MGLKSILGSRSRTQSLEALSKLSELGYVRYSLNAKTKKLTYQITDWVVECSGEECMNGSVYATEGYGFLCLPRSITDRLVEQNYIFDEADAWLDLWCHTVSGDFGNAFSFLAPIVQFGKFGTVLTLEILGQRWNWEKTKVWRFFQKHRDAFMLHRLPGAYGCLIFNKLYPSDTEFTMPESEKIERIIAEIRILAKNEQKVGSDQENLGRLIALYSRILLTDCAESAENTSAQNRVALFDPYILHAYFSHSNCKKCNAAITILCVVLFCVELLIVFTSFLYLFFLQKLIVIYGTSAANEFRSGPCSYDNCLSDHFVFKPKRYCHLFQMHADKCRANV